MHWKVTEPMNERAKFLALHQEGLYSMNELCQRFGLSRQTGYKWLNRFKATGIEGLEEQSRAPHTCPHQTASDVEEALLQARQEHPTWGAKKLLPYLKKRRPDLAERLPAPRTAGEMLKRHGLSRPGTRPARNSKHAGGPPLCANAPNRVWMADSKGQFPTGEGQDCYPLSVSDAYSRFLCAS